MRAIFISYRRDDSEGQAGRLYGDLVRRFGEDSVFMDVAGIAPGLDFRQVIDQQVSSCGALLAMIGPNWAEVKNEAGERRLDDPADFVRLETASALRRNILVIPVLVHGGKMPRADQLPDDLKELAWRNGSELTHPRWDSDVKLLIQALEWHLADELADQPGAAPQSSLDPLAPGAAGVDALPGPLQLLPAAVIDNPTHRLRRRERKMVWKLAALVLLAAVVISLAVYVRSTGIPTGILGKIRPMIQAVLAARQVTPANSIPNFAGTWELFESTFNGQDDLASISEPMRRPFILTQDGPTVTLGNRRMRVTGAGTLTYQTYFAADGQQGHPVQTEDEADLVDTITLILEGPILVFETSFHYRNPYFGHPAGTEVRIRKYRRIAS